jgi:hypothetical protein
MVPRANLGVGLSLRRHSQRLSWLAALRFWVGRFVGMLFLHAWRVAVEIRRGKEQVRCYLGDKEKESPKDFGWMRWLDRADSGELDPP